MRKHLDETWVKGPGVERPCEEPLKLGEQGLRVRKHLDLSGRQGSGGPARTRSFRAWSDCHKQCGQDPPVYWGSSRSRSGSSFTGRNASGQWRIGWQPYRPVLKHGPRSLTCARVSGLYET